ncbi:hypothetical protein, partial [Candidatus Deferrimicrobium sp.]|uniref:hypothetical protein n=1 Tax=Candidatus Deferrimicrobium sp. TaxID=3060586 RepID=UPI002ED148DA
NAILAGCGFNLRKLLRSFFTFIFGWHLIRHSEVDTDHSGRLLAPVAALKRVYQGRLVILVFIAAPATSPAVPLPKDSLCLPHPPDS